ncbi:polyphosphate kinase 2, internal deletion [Myxococcus xanthus DK 1622]|uniref:Polyphosphate kinase 2, internal deletion n=2 Tax=Myxococcaceae TaxID=31 RepID=Q1DAH9_MYXXD|nr:polyphosphate kinase 2, internal deletion [Myxococcus xanthus DK 1622]
MAPDTHTEPMKRKAYEKELRRLQAQLCMLQDWVKQEGVRVVVVFEGRDAAGKGGTIRAITERVSPRVFRVVALPVPSDREKTQMYPWTRWYDYSQARDMMLAATDTPYAPWFILRSDNKKKARLNCIRFLLEKIPHKRVKRPEAKLPRRSKRGAYDDEASLAGKNFIPERY